MITLYYAYTIFEILTHLHLPRK